MKKYGILPLLLAFFAAPQLHAEEAVFPQDQALSRCLKQADNTFGSSDCYQKATVAWDKELNLNYRLLMAELHAPEAKTQLKRSQRAWIAYRDSYNKTIHAFYLQQEGSVWGLVAAQNKLQIIREKAIALKRLRESADLS